MADIGKNVSKKRAGRRILRLMICLSAIAIGSLYICYRLTTADQSGIIVSKLKTLAETEDQSCVLACRKSLFIEDERADGDYWATLASNSSISSSIAYIAMARSTGSGNKEEEITIAPGDCVCVRAVVPPASSEIIDTQPAVAYKPIPGWPEDSIMADLVMVGSDDVLYKDARVTVSVEMHRTTAPSVYSGGRRYYEGAARLYDPGTYKLDARLEYRDSQWNADPGQPSVPYNEQMMRGPRDIGQTAAAAGSIVRVRTDGSHWTHLGRHQSLRLCTAGDEPGRWIPTATLQRMWQPHQYVVAAEDSRTWVPYHCRLQRVTYAQFAHHMARTYPSVHWFGDSNSRRTLRPFVMGGKWCYEADTVQRLDCLCNDAPKDLYPSEWYAQMQLPHWYRIRATGVNGSEILAGNTNNVMQESLSSAVPAAYFHPPAGTEYGPEYIAPNISSSASNDFFDLYYQFTRGTQDMYGSYWARDITEHAASAYPRAKLVVFQMITWDAAFGEYAAFTRQVNLLATRLRRVYPNAQFIYRSGPYWCCRNAEADGKKYSRLRFVAFDRYARAVFRRRLKARVWDVMSVQANRPPESKRLSENMPCLSAHSRGELIHLDNQILMNMVVNANQA
ncbi:hypothetical protein H4217_006497 [Coemansia sp. RSA 1939]|nr:hypothetical protein H4217_006497 [Coemansia sp. RSA 1939]KAJ2602996.1 hypothetical protein EV177_006742 [Coemansia sp. RSA 1804]